MENPDERLLNNNISMIDYINGLKTEEKEFEDFLQSPQFIKFMYFYEKLTSFVKKHINKDGSLIKKCNNITKSRRASMLIQAHVMESIVDNLNIYKLLLHERIANEEYYYNQYLKLKESNNMENNNSNYETHARSNEDLRDAMEGGPLKENNSRSQEQSSENQNSPKNDQ